MYHYKVYFSLVKEDANFDFKTIEAQIQRTIVKYNNGVNIRNKKKLRCHVFKEHIEIEIESNIALEVPSKSLAKFTQVLLVEAPVLRNYIVHKRVFKGISPATQEKPEPVDEQTIDSIEALDTIKKALDLFFEKTPITFEEKRIKERKQREIKKILFDLNC